MGQGWREGLLRKTLVCGGVRGLMLLQCVCGQPHCGRHLSKAHMQSIRCDGPHAALLIGAACVQTCHAHYEYMKNICNFNEHDAKIVSASS